MTTFAFVALFGWVPVVLCLFMMMPARRAAVFAVVGGWLLLPPITVGLSGVPDFSKNTSATFGILLATAIFQPQRLIQFRPKWFDIPMILWCSSGMWSALSNSLPPYDGFSISFGVVVGWGLPYLVGRIYFSTLEGLRELGLGIVAGGLIYVPMCLFEIRMSPQIAIKIYGTGSWQGTRLGGYRPYVFFGTGLELGMWMTASSLTAWWMWLSGSMSKKWRLPLVGDVPFGPVLLPVLLVTTLLCRSTGALALLGLGMAILWISAKFKTALPLLAITLAVCAYPCLRIPNYWSGQNAVDVAKAVVGPERAQSLEYRFECEALLLQHALERPMLGWSGWGRNRVFFDEGQTKNVPMDGLWIGVFGSNGTVGLVLLYIVVLLPVWLMIRRYPAVSWKTAAVAPAAVYGTFLSLYMIDLLMNAFINLIYLVAMGGLIGTIPALSGLGRKGARQVDGKSEPVALTPSHGESMPMGITAVSKRRRAEGYLNMAKSLGASEQAEVALRARRHALDLLGEAWLLHPEDEETRRRWCDCANDLSWSLANHADPFYRNAEEACELARRATLALPSEETYWNTLGAALYRAGDFVGAVGALERSIELGGGTGFDYSFMAMAQAKLGDRDQGEHWLRQAVQWTNQERPGHEGMARLCEEARSILSSGPALPVVQS